MTYIWRVVGSANSLLCFRFLWIVFVFLVIGQLALLRKWQFSIGICIQTIEALTKWQPFSENPSKVPRYDKRVPEDFHVSQSPFCLSVCCRSNAPGADRWIQCMSQRLHGTANHLRRARRLTSCPAAARDRPWGRRDGFAVMVVPWLSVPIWLKQKY